MRETHDPTNQVPNTARNGSLLELRTININAREGDYPSAPVIQTNEQLTVTDCLTLRCCDDSTRCQIMCFLPFAFGITGYLLYVVIADSWK